MTRALASPFGCVEGSPPRRGGRPEPPREHQDSPQADRRQTEIAGVHLRDPSPDPATNQADVRERDPIPFRQYNARLTRGANLSDLRVGDFLQPRTALTATPPLCGVAVVVALVAQPQMVRIDAGSRIAGVPHNGPLRDVAMRQNKRYAVRVGVRLIAPRIPLKRELPIAAPIGSGGPEPTAISSLVFGVESCY